MPPLTSNERLNNMSDNLDWGKLAQTKASEVERPPLLPAGHYQFLHNGTAKRDKTQKGTLFAEFPVRLTEPMDDVDAEELAAAGGLPDRNQNITFYLTEKSLFRFTEYGQAMGGNPDSNVIELIDYLQECEEPGVVQVKHETDDKNPDRVYVRFDNPMPLSVFQQRQQG
jgi:hypothetical protein